MSLEGLRIAMLCAIAVAAPASAQQIHAPTTAAEVSAPPRGTVMTRDETAMKAEAASAAWLIAPTLAIVFSSLVPFSILLGRYAVRRQRQANLENLRQTLRRSIGREASLIASFEHALQKYDMEEPGGRRGRVEEIFFNIATSIIFILVSAAGMTWLIDHANPGTTDQFRYALGGIQTVPVVTVDKQNYELKTGAGLTPVSWRGESLGSG